MPMLFCDSNELPQRLARRTQPCCVKKQKALSQVIAAKGRFESGALDNAGFFQGLEGAVLGHGLEGTGGQLDRDVTLQFGDVDALLFQVRLEDARRVGRDVRTDTALFLGFTATENAGAATVS